MKKRPAEYKEIPDAQHRLFERGWEHEWVGMPEFVQGKQREFAKIVVRFRCQSDLDAFSRLIGQKLNQRSQCTWYPELVSHGQRLVYVDESAISDLHRVEGAMEDQINGADARGDAGALSDRRRTTGGG